MIRLSLSSNGGFVKKIRERQSKWQGRKFEVRITVPPELFWWYYLEFGTAPYTIKAKNAKLLAFPGSDGNLIRKKEVDHPGIRKRQIVERILPYVRDKLEELAKKAFIDGAVDDPQILLSALLETLTISKGYIVASLEEQAPGTRDDNPEFPQQSGKLHGRTAGEVFDELAEVKEVE